MSKNIEKAIKDKLTEAFSPDVLEVIDESHQHAGHFAMKDPEKAKRGQSHFRVRIKAACFKDKSRLAVHRSIYHILAEELKEIHALAIDQL